MVKRTNTAAWLEKYSRWQIKVQKDGERKTFTSSTPGRTGQREANAKADAWMDDNISGGGTRIEVLYNSYLADLKSRTPQSNWKGEDTRGRVWIVPEIGRIKIENLIDQHLQEIVNKAYTAGLAKKSLMNIRASLAAFVKYCRKCKVTTYFPENMIIPKSAPTKPKTVLQPQDILTLFTIDTTMYRGKRQFDDLINAYRFQVLTGLRPGELLGLMWNDVDGDVLHIRRSINVYGEITSGKNDNALRSFVLTPMSINVLGAQKSISNSIYIFGEIMEQGYRKRWKKYCEANGLPSMTPYELRHTFVSAIQALPEAQIKNLVGHSKNMDTFGVYAHKMQGQQAQSATDIERIFNSILTQSKPSGL